ncbi:hypothetical protein H4R34_003313 [Dimargaris verticillata]|uniref:Kinase n=1 Tax=Dimargaris verticillata TaxID=2761393 RepID=A0A9W8B0X7_9FUNG|nr:hypothetical protein H4R34_003313 [Dimargaris verticillata]
MERLEHQVAGHGDIYKDFLHDDRVWKPTNRHEADFYDRARTDPQLTHDFRKLMPKFFGSRIRPDAHPSPSSTSTSSTTTASQSSASSKVIYEVNMENVFYGLVQGSHIDLKLGSRLYGKNVQNNKRLKMEKQAKQSTSAEYALRIAGMVVYDPLTREITKPERDELRTMDIDRLKGYLAEYFPATLDPDYRQKLLTMFRLALVDVQAAIRDSQVFLVGSSLLVVYESDPAAYRAHCPENVEAATREERERVFRLRLIDFGHAELDDFDEEQASDAAGFPTGVFATNRAQILKGLDYLSQFLRTIQATSTRTLSRQAARIV